MIITCNPQEKIDIFKIYCGMIIYMKKIILALLLIVVVYLVGTRFFNNPGIDPDMALAQAFNNTSTTSPQIILASKKVDFAVKKDAVYILADFATKADQKTMVTIGQPKILKDGVIYTSTSTNPKFQAGIIKKILYGWTTRNITSTSTFELAKGKNIYRMAWVINKNNLPAGAYQITFDGFVIGNSTTSISLNTPFPNAIIISPTGTNTSNTSTYLEGNHYKLVSYNKNLYTKTNPPVISFQNGMMNARFCNNMSGTYELKNTSLKVKNMTSTMMACGGNLGNLENTFTRALSEGFKIKTNGEYLTLSGGYVRAPAEFVFIKYTPATTTGTITGAGDLINGSLPLLTSISTTSTTLGSSITLGGTNFATSNVVMFTQLSSTLATPKAVARVATTSTNSLVFTIPTSYICEDGTTICGSVGSITAGVYRVQVKTPAGMSPGSFTVVIN